MKSGIYKILCKPSNNFYIGSAINLDKRFYRHRWELNNNRHSNEALQRSYTKYGFEAFEFHILEYVENATKQILIGREQFYIDNLNPKYNIKRKADSNFGVKRSKETCQKMSISQKGHYVSEETKLKLSLLNKGKSKHTDKSKALIGLASKGNKYRLGTKHSEETKLKIGRWGKGRKHTEVQTNMLKARAKPNKWPHGCQCKCKECKIIRNSLYREYLKGKANENFCK